MQHGTTRTNVVAWHGRARGEFLAHNAVNANNADNADNAINANNAVRFC
jgi:hypothetical protein